MRNSITLFSSVQWLFFIFANTVVVPLSIGTAFELPAADIAMMVKTTLIFTGIACILQARFGHGYPIMEGHSGIFWGVMLNLSLSASSLGLSLTEIGGGIATGILLSAVATVLLATFNLVSWVQRIFPPMVASVYLFLLSFQLIFIFFEGMLGKKADGTLDIPVSLLSVFIVILVILLKIKGNTLISNFSILIGIVVGWILYVLLFPGQTTSANLNGNTFTLFPLGKPNLELGIIIVTFFAGLLNISNTVASIDSAARIFNDKVKFVQYRKSMFLTGIYSIFASGFGLVPYTPFTSTIGFLQSTRIYDRKPFYLGGALLTIMGLIPIFGSFLATMPITIGNAVLLVSYLQLFGTAYSSLNGATFTSNSIFRFAIPLLFGVSLMNLPVEIYSSLPALIQPFISNGLIMGMLLSIIFELAFKWERLEPAEGK
ncbi:MAG TPA: uracil/xanthine transporter [Bacillus sp. (in: firmicutes)]|uniref:uracil/xanthine transporter n=1 Tax=Bacillus litorisediminis TaxID=2922713 RepID=UPI001FAD5A28|nr:uracil/xanthine transporter [Bacillus litorisediminis]HWO75396.1 uracil/xanthine transporter [Bacillus sp. (in: firmicutes)]